KLGSGIESPGRVDWHPAKAKAARRIHEQRPRRILFSFLLISSRFRAPRIRRSPRHAGRDPSSHPVTPETARTGRRRRERPRRVRREAISAFGIRLPGESMLRPPQPVVLGPTETGEVVETNRAHRSVRAGEHFAIRSRTARTVPIHPGRQALRALRVPNAGRATFA